MVDLTKNKLTKRQLEVLTIMSEEGLSNDEIAERLYITRRTVKNHLQHIYYKLGIFSSREAIVYYYKKIKNVS